MQQFNVGYHNYPADLHQFPKRVFAPAGIFYDLLEQPSGQFARMDGNGHCPSGVRMAQRNMASTLTLKFEASLFERAYQLFCMDARQPTPHTT